MCPFFTIRPREICYLICDTPETIGGSPPIRRSKAFALLSTKIDDLHLDLHMNPCDVGYDIVTLLRRYRFGTSSI